MLGAVRVIATIVAAGLAAPASADAQNAGLMQTVSYSADDSEFPNPERGFSLPGTPSNIASVRQGNMTLVHSYFRLDPFKSTPLSSEFLDEVQKHFDAVRSAGIKSVPRFIYNFPAGLPLKPGDEDAPLPRVLEHIDQLEPVLRRNSDVIAYLEAGFVGAWGEWHNSTSGLDTTASKSAVLKRLLRALPQDRFVSVRYQRDKTAIFSRIAPATADEILAGTDLGRVAHHNDCFLAAPDDWGTYQPTDDEAVKRQKSYLAAENEHAPQGGETCNVGPEAQPFIGCAHALGEIARLHWTQLNAAYHPGVIDRWRREGCFDQIAKGLGFRLRLVSASLPSIVRAGTSLTGMFTIANDGFAAPYNKRPVELILRARSTGRTTVIPLAIDPRRWTSGKDHRAIIAAEVPAAVAPGSYEVLVSLPDAAAGLRIRPEYAIRLANQGTWEAATGYNRLLTTVRVLP
jgi:hypothetical protein